MAALHGGCDFDPSEDDPMAKPVTLNLVPKSFGDSYFWIAAFKGNEETGPFGLGNSPTEAVNELVDAAEVMLTVLPASNSPVFTELQELPS
jgi:hypothetical protein